MRLSVLCDLFRTHKEGVLSRSFREWKICEEKALPQRMVYVIG